MTSSTNVSPCVRQGYADLTYLFPCIYLRLNLGFCPALERDIFILKTSTDSSLLLCNTNFMLICRASTNTIHVLGHECHRHTQTPNHSKPKMIFWDLRTTLIVVDVLDIGCLIVIRRLPTTPHQRKYK
jgi:hypothetical protein